MGDEEEMPRVYGFSDVVHELKCINNKLDNIDKKLNFEHDSLVELLRVFLHIIDCVFCISLCSKILDSLFNHSTLN